MRLILYDYWLVDGISAESFQCVYEHINNKTVVSITLTICMKVIRENHLKYGMIYDYDYDLYTVDEAIVMPIYICNRWLLCPVLGRYWKKS